MQGGPTAGDHVTACSDLARLLIITVHDRQTQTQTKPSNANITPTVHSDMDM